MIPLAWAAPVLIAAPALLWAIRRHNLRRLASVPPGNYPFSTALTLVTGLFDCRLEEHFHLKDYHEYRTMELYLTWFRDVLKFRVPMVVYIDERYVDFVKEARADLAAWTKIVPVSREALLGSPYYSGISRVMADPAFHGRVRRPQRMELHNPLLNTVLFSKLDWVMEAIQANLFSSRYFLWMDGGYMHGIRQTRCAKYVGTVWPNPGKLPLLDDDRLLFLIRRAPTQRYRRDMDRHYPTHNAFINTSCYAGTAAAFERIRPVYRRAIDRTLQSGLMDNDECVMGSVWHESSESFRLIRDRQGLGSSVMEYLNVGLRMLEHLH